MCATIVLLSLHDSLLLTGHTQSRWRSVVAVDRWVLSSWRRTRYFRAQRYRPSIRCCSQAPLCPPAISCCWIHSPLCRWPRNFSLGGEFAVRLMYSKTLTPGRDAACNVRITVPAVSRQYAVIRVEGRQVFLEYNIDLISLHLVVPPGPPVVHQSHYRQRRGDPRQGPPKEQ